MTWRLLCETYAPPLLTVAVGLYAICAAMTARGDGDE